MRQSEFLLPHSYPFKIQYDVQVEVKNKLMPTVFVEAAYNVPFAMIQGSSLAFGVDRLRV